MSKINLYIIITAALSLAGCQKYLDKEPDNRTQIKTPAQIAQLLTTAYPKGNYIPFCEAMSDNAEDKNVAGAGYGAQDQVNRQSFRFEVVSVSPDDLDGPDFYWNECYKAIAAANQALEYIAAIPDSASVSAHKGEALVARAYAHFMLVTLFSKVYDPATAANDPGVPYVTETEKTIFKDYERSTVANVYDMIEKDLLGGYPLLNDAIYGSAPKFHFNKRAAAAFAARFYLFKGDYPKVISFASDALGTSPQNNLRPWNTLFLPLQYAELEAEYSKSTTAGNLLLQEAASIWGRSYPFMRFSLGDQLANYVFGQPNVTGGYYAYPLYGTAQAYNTPKFYEYFVKETINAGTGSPYNTIPLFTGDEALLNRAEAYLFNGEAQKAIDDLNTFAARNIDGYTVAQHNLTSTKIANYYQASATLSILFAILDFKQAAFIHEGMRWFDIIRLGIPVTHTTVEGESIQLPADDDRRVLQLPTLTKQAGLEPNPR